MATKASACFMLTLPNRTVWCLPSPATNRMRRRPLLSLPMLAMVHLPSLHTNSPVSTLKYSASVLAACALMPRLPCNISDAIA